MTDIDRDMCRKAAAECVELARATNDPAKKEILITRAQEWLKLAYAKSETEFTRLVAELNEGQMAPMQRVPMQQQPVQQQQSKTNEKPTILVRAAPPQGFHWKVIAEGRTVASGTTATEFEARAMANSALKEIEKEAGPP